MEENKIPTEPLDFDIITLGSDSDGRSPVGMTSCLKFSEEDFKSIESEVTDYIEEALNDSSRQDMIDTLTENEMAIRGIFDRSKEKAYSSSSEIVSSLTGSHCRIISNAIARTYLISPYFVSAGIAPEEHKNVLQDFMNEKGRSDFDYESMVMKMSKVAVETPAAILNPEWEYKTRKEIRVEVFKDVAAFTAKYPDADSANLTEGQYTKKLTQVVKDIQAKGYHQCEYEMDVVVKNSPKINVIHPADFVMFPFNAIDVELAKLAGHMVYETFDGINRLERSGIYFDKSSNRIKSSYISSGTDGNDDIRDVQEQEKGIGTSLTGKETFRSKIYPIIKGRIRWTLGDSGEERDYEFAYAVDEQILLRFARARTYSSERPYFFAEIDPNTKSIWGNYIPEMIKNIQETISTILRQLVDSNTIANVPTFKAKSTEREWFERTYQDLKFKPGKVWWLQNPSMFEQFRVQPIDANAFLKIVQYLTQDGETLDGGNRALAGQPLSEDPEAPGVKQAMMIQQSNFMINQYIKNLSMGLEKALNYVRSLYDQHLEYNEEIKIEGKNRQTDLPFIATVTKEDIPLLSPDLKITVRPQRVDDNMSQRLADLRQDFEMFMSVPDIQQNPFSKRTIIKTYMHMRDMYTEEEINKLLMSPQEIMQQLMSASQDMAAADQITAQQNDLVRKQESDAQASKDAIIQQLMEQEQQTQAQAATLTQ